jgi:Fur family ferric uptake transcriptional regulator
MLQQPPSPTASLAALDRAGYRRTPQRRQVTNLIAARDGHFTAADLEADARRAGQGLGRATIYRTLEVLLQAGVVERIELADGSHAYVACAARHHHHAICTGCGAVMEFDDRELSSVVAELARRTGYRIDEHRVEVFGRCPACLAAERSR